MTAAARSNVRNVSSSTTPASRKSFSGSSACPAGLSQLQRPVDPVAASLRFAAGSGYAGVVQLLFLPRCQLQQLPSGHGMCATLGISAGCQSHHVPFLLRGRITKPKLLDVVAKYQNAAPTCWLRNPLIRDPHVHMICQALTCSSQLSLSLVSLIWSGISCLAKRRNGTVSQNSGDQTSLQPRAETWTCG